MKTLEYNNEAERQSIIDREVGSGFTLSEERNHSDGDFLVFITAGEAVAKEKKDAKKDLSERDRSGVDVRLLEDIAELLIAKGVFAENELPPQAQERLNKRRELRAKI